MAEAETRRLAAIMFTDIVGFSRQMGANEARMLRVLEAHDQIIQRAVAEHYGHVIKTMGDAFLVDFPPRYPPLYSNSLGFAYLLMGRYEEAIAALKKALSRSPNWLPAHANLAVVYSELGQEAGARAEAAEVLRISPNWSPESLSLRQKTPFKDQAVSERYLTALRKAGLK